MGPMQQKKRAVHASPKRTKKPARLELVAKDHDAWRSFRAETMRLAEADVRKKLAARLKARHAEKSSRAAAVETALARAKQAIAHWFAGDVQARERDIVCQEARRALQALRDAFALAKAAVADVEVERATGGPNDLSRLRSFMSEVGDAASVALPPATVPFDASPTDHLLHELWMQVNGGPGWCRVCNARLGEDPAEPCSECGATHTFARAPGPHGGLWWPGKAKPQDLALVLILADVFSRAEWKDLAKSTTAAGAIDVVSNRVKVQLHEMREKLRKRRRDFVSRHPDAG